MIINYKMTVQYKGTNFNGWQRQNQGKQRTVQGILENKLSRFFGKKVEINGAGRTDKGTHSMGQVANFTVDTVIPFDNLKNKIQKLLPDDIYIYDIESVNLNFHARYDAKGKFYRYKILNANHRNPVLMDTYYYVNEKLDIEKMKLASSKLIGKKDFKSFMAAGSPMTNTVREVRNIDINKNEDFIEIDFYGDGFLYKMVRIMVGLLIDVSMEKIFIEDIDEIIESKDRTLLKHTAPAHGLYLMEVFY